MSRDWSAFDGFSRPIEERSWQGVIAWTSAIEAQLGADRSALAQQRRESDQVLLDLGGDPSARDWTAFLPLRRDREEDWSDWLAQLIEDSATGRFAWSLLGAIESRHIDSYIEPTVHREVASEGYRADLVVEWVDASYTHIEVKVGDKHLAKTLGTAQNVEKRFGIDRRRRSDIVLLLPSQDEAWAMESADLHDRVHLVTWLDVALALRNALPLGGRESIHWRVWAHAFCGAVEQDLLGLRAGREPDTWARSLTFQGLATAAQMFDVGGDR